ncbi:hypothetical protein AMAG_19732 [Allomyces macrogynus ATCC 38327]|uniref:Orn/DAP/Arg decarboxylase 2 N-terminal domain-containing protein n=1 Tax=Allomyces macrogynus (strain ATCC 38327) TaxID=578462 RepID=A0A0L0T1P1_ALLM3|nr:hypothetical protein AMAG_19732 [Allomyces macrogynus ATCC 38327]|eukprot:KNE68489.1 hypothetical protein AMAG_19732 [Allomyces macrogynus ATCC 38327]
MSIPSPNVGDRCNCDQHPQLSATFDDESTTCELHGPPLPAATAVVNKPTTGPATVAAIPHTKPAPALLRDILAAQLQQQPAVDDTSILVADVGHVYRQYNQWREYLPIMEPFYAVKCKVAPVILELLMRAGAGFIASKWELDQVLAAGANPAKIMNAKPNKPVSYLRQAAASGVRLMTFDTVGELHKITRTRCSSCA